ncbi:MAG: hypothetical protein IH899_19725 [Planctomycetes bacterium]|nr:hypothetical protein [Planctomycetota bacterium]
MTFVFFWLCTMSRVAAAQTSGGTATETSEVRRAVSRILESPEFRHFKRLSKHDLLKGGKGWRNTSQGDGSSQDGSTGRTRDEDGSGRRAQKGNDSLGEGTSGNEQLDDDSNETEDSSGFGAGSLGGFFSESLGLLFHGVAWFFLIAVCVLIVFLIVKAMIDYDRPVKLHASGEGGASFENEEPELVPGVLPADVYFHKAGELAASGKYRDAIAQLLLGAMSHVERAGLIKYRSGLTLRNYVRALREDTTISLAMRNMVRTFEPLGFGRREATKQHFEQTLSNYEKGFRGSSQVLEN